MLSSAVLIYLICSVLAIKGSDDAIYTRDFPQFRFGAVRPYKRGPKVKATVWHIEQDIVNNFKLLYSDGGAVREFDDEHEREYDIAGVSVSRDDEPPYQEGLGTQARFSTITDFTQLNGTHILAIDSTNNCLRMIDRGSGSTSRLAGLCGAPNATDEVILENGSLLDARFSKPQKLAFDSIKSIAYITDTQNYAIRDMNLITGQVNTFVHTGEQPLGIALSLDNLDLFITTPTNVLRIFIHSKVQVNLIESDNTGFADGPLTTAKVNNPTDILEIGRHLLLLMDTDNNRLRVINMVAGTISSICNGETSTLRIVKSIDECQLQQPRAAAVAGRRIEDKRNRRIYIGSSAEKLTILEGTKPKRKMRPQGDPGGMTDGSEDTAGDSTAGGRLEQTTIIIIAVVTLGVVVIVIIPGIVFICYKRAKLNRQLLSEDSNRHTAAVSSRRYHTSIKRLDSGLYTEIDPTYQAIDLQRMEGMTNHSGTGLPHSSTPTDEYGDTDHNKYYYATQDSERHQTGLSRETSDDKYADRVYADADSYQPPTTDETSLYHPSDHYDKDADLEPLGDTQRVVDDPTDESSNRPIEPDRLDYGYLDFNSIAC